MTEDYRALADQLEAVIEGEVRFDAGSRGLYATDASNYRQLPIGVVVPRTREDVIRTVEACRLNGAPVLARGGGTSLAGQCCNVAVVMDMSKYYHRILDLDPDARTARIQPGIVLDDLRGAAGEHGLTFGPDPATHSHCTLGGMMGNNSCGIHSVMAGKTVDNVVSLEVLTYDGTILEVGPTDDAKLSRILESDGREAEIYRRLRALRDRLAERIRAEYPDIPRRVSGYNLDDLLPEKGLDLARALIGSEGTCVTILEATVRLVANPPRRTLVVLGYPDVYHAADHVMEILRHDPIGLEGIDGALVGYMKKKGLNLDDLGILPDGEGWLLVEFGGESKDESDARARDMMEDLRGRDDAPHMKLYDDPFEESKAWEVRESGLGATARVPGMSDTWPGWEDSAVAPERLGDYLRDLRALFDEYDYETALYGHFGQGCVHCRIPFDLRTADGLETYRSFVHEAAELCVSYGGSLSGEHGDGVARGPLLGIMYSDEILDGFREFKSIWDPEHRMNPGRIVEAESIVDHLRLGTDYEPARVETYFQFPDDDHDFSRATLRCVGVGKCRRREGGTMCPSYMATREEMHSTRGRARLLFEMLNGSELEVWKDDHVKEALDLCLACKGCKSDCPVNVDMATYKAEFLAHYYDGRLRPPTAYSMGLFYWWARLASAMPRVVNRVSHAPVLGDLLKRLGGIASEREVPRFAEVSFREWFQRHEPARPEGREILLWPDTFNNYLHPDTARAAVRVLEDAGCRVRLPERTLCCGRPLYDYGMLGLARRQLEQILDALRPKIRAGVPLVGLEPSCVAVFRDELRGLFPEDEDAMRLAEQTFLLSEFLVERLERYQPPRLERKALVHIHCHHKSALGTSAEMELLSRLGLDYEVLDSGCCGLAGAFGFERGKYDVSMAVGERVLLPAVRKADRETLLVTNGFSCRTQIEHATGRRAHHLAEVLALALDARETGSSAPARTSSDA